MRLIRKDDFRKAKLICYSEWWFKINGDEYKYDNNKYISYSNTMQAMYLRNLPMAMELIEADQIVCPTEWQKDNIQEYLKTKL